MKIAEHFILTARSLLRLSSGAYILGVSGTTEPTPLLSILLRLLFSVGRWFQVLSKRLLRRRRQGNAAAPPLKASAANGVTAMRRQPNSRGSNGTFRRVWTPPGTRARFERKRLMRMLHRQPKGTRGFMPEK